MKNQYKVAIIGGGASGMLCAIELLLDGNFFGEQIVLLEKNDRVGKKLLATGNGQCNLSNANLSPQNFHGNPQFINAVFNTVVRADVCAYLQKLGIVLTTAKDGKIYPLSKQATAVLDVLRAFLQSKGCVIRTGENVTKIKNGKNNFTIYSSTGEYQAEKVVLAFGGSVGKQFGTDGSSYSLATDFGHSLTKLYPSLVQLKTKTDNIKGLKGIKETACVTAYDGDKALASATGDVLFTEFGVSGNAVFQISGYLAMAKNPSVKLSFVPEITTEQLEKQIALRQSLDYIDKEEVLCSIVNKQLGRAIMKTQRDKSAKGLALALKDFNLQVTGTLGFNNAQVTKGGISTQHVCPNTFESRLVNGLYIIGEALDVDGDCGGYNLTFAFASAINCAKHIKSKK